MNNLNLIHYLLLTFSLIYSIHGYETSNQCRSSINRISLLLSDVSHCLMTNSGPMSACLNCNLKYQIFINESDFVRREIKTINGVNCFKAIDECDKFKTISTLINNMSKVWNSSNCEFCFKSQYSNEYIDVVKKYIEKHQVLLSCLQPYINSDVSLCDGIDFPYKNTTFNESGCTRCYSAYTDLVSIYEELRRDEIHGICGDIENLFTCARVSIEKYFKCPRQMSTLINSWPIIVIVASTLIFYSCSSMCHEKNQIEIYNQSRVMACFVPDVSSAFGGSSSSHHHCHTLNSRITVGLPYESDNDGSMGTSVHSTHLPVREVPLFLSIPEDNCGGGYHNFSAKE